LQITRAARLNIRRIPKETKNQQRANKPIITAGIPPKPRPNILPRDHDLAPLNGSGSYVRVGLKGGRMPRLCHTVEQILAKLWKETRG